MIEKFEIKDFILRDKFKNHSQKKEHITKLILDTDDKGWYNNTGNFNDRLLKTDWPLADNPERTWVKYFINDLHFQLNNFADHLGYTNVLINKVWYQIYEKNGIHNWHIHADNYSGVYYIKMPEDDENNYTEFLSPNDFNRSFKIKVNEGDVIFFPSHLIHRAPALQKNDTKIIISWNANVESVKEEITTDKTRTSILD
jgi:hypothetical protein